MKEVFLIAALSMPLSFVPDSNDRCDVGVFQFLASYYHQNPPRTTGIPKRVYIIGDEKTLLLSFIDSGLEAWRVVPVAETNHDVVALPNAIPFRNETALAVIYLLETKRDRWGSMELLSQAIYSLCKGGVLAFYPDMAPHFGPLAHSLGFEKLPWTWYQMQLWKKNGKKIPFSRQVHVIGESA